MLVHSGQHYAYELDARFFSELQLPTPDYMLAVGSGPHGAQTGTMLMRLEPILLSERPDMVLVQGDTNTTLAGGLCAAKLGIPVAHLEAGERSFNRNMPEEMNRIVVDHLSTLLLAADGDAEHHLRNEGLPDAKIRVVGSTAVDAALRAGVLTRHSQLLEQLELTAGDYLTLTLHRAENTIPAVLPGILAAIDELAAKHPVILPLHPRTRAAMQQQNLVFGPHVRVIEPLGYIDMLALVGGAMALLTDSGGLQEEAAVMNTPALVLRNETEWRYLVDAGFNVLVGNRRETILAHAAELLNPAALDRLRSARPLLAEGAAARAVEAMAAYLKAA